MKRSTFRLGSIGSRW